MVRVKLTPRREYLRKAEKYLRMNYVEDIASRLPIFEGIYQSIVNYIKDPSIYSGKKELYVCGGAPYGSVLRLDHNLQKSDIDIALSVYLLECFFGQGVTLDSVFLEKATSDFNQKNGPSELSEWYWTKEGKIVYSDWQYFSPLFVGNETTRMELIEVILKTLRADSETAKNLIKQYNFHMVKPGDMLVRDINFNIKWLRSLWRFPESFIKYKIAKRNLKVNPDLLVEKIEDLEKLVTEF